MAAEHHMQGKICTWVGSRREEQLLAGRKGRRIADPAVEELQGFPKCRVGTLKHSFTARERNDKFSVLFLPSIGYVFAK